MRQTAGQLPYGVADGARTRDLLDHNQAFYQLNYSHHLSHSDEYPLYLTGGPQMKLLRRLRAMYPLTSTILAGKNLALPKNAVTNCVSESSNAVLTGTQVKRTIDRGHFH